MNDITVEELQRKYPEPIPAWTDIAARTPESYCVGGAFCLSLGRTGNSYGSFPEPNDLAGWLRLGHPTLDVAEALDIARHIIDENDAGNFEDAWAWLSKGLST